MAGSCYAITLPVSDHPRSHTSTHFTSERRLGCNPLLRKSISATIRGRFCSSTYRRGRFQSPFKEERLCDSQLCVYVQFPRDRLLSGFKALLTADFCPLRWPPKSGQGS